MKKQTALWCLSLLLVMGACTTSSSRKTAGEWAKVPGILKNIVPPAFADTVYDVTDYGAKSDTLSTAVPPSSKPSVIVTRTVAVPYSFPQEIISSKEPLH